MSEYYITVASSIDSPNALVKARKDVEVFAALRGMQEVRMMGADSAHGSRLKWFGLLLACIRDWRRLEKALPPNSIVLVQYPHFPIKSAPILRIMLPRIMRKKKCRFVALIHDLDSLRAINGAAARFSDRYVLPCFSAIICHNDAMRQKLMDMGIAQERLITLGLFDFVTRIEAPEHCYEKSVVVAGNLSREKSGYLYKLVETQLLTYPLHLYGAGFEASEGPCGQVHYHGARAAELLPGELRGAFGLVWDGDSETVCTGDYGEYLRLNNPHKVSLYLTSGIPVIIWKEAALAEYIQQRGLGVTIASLQELGSCLDGVTPDEYRKMCENARMEAVRLRNGFYFNKAMDAVA